jgi:type VI secretion system protein VasI
MNRVLSIALLLAVPQIAMGQEEDIKRALAGCAALDIETARLDCFEQLARAVAQIPAEPPAPPVSKFKGSAGPGKWKVEASTNPVDDSKTVALGLVDGSDSMQLVLLCQQGKPRAYVTTGKYLGAKSTLVLTRIGGAKAETKPWPLSMNQKAAFFPGDAGLFIRKLATVERLVVQVSPFDENPTTAVFNLGGLPDVMPPLTETCRLP